MSKVLHNAVSAEASPKLSDPQRKILQNASRRSDFLVVIRKGNEPEARSPISALIRRGFLAEKEVREGQPAWKRNSDGVSIGLEITLSGLQAIGREVFHPTSSVERDVRQPDVAASQQPTQPAPKNGHADTHRDHGSSKDAPEQIALTPLRAHGGPKQHARLGSKRALIIDLLRRGDGAALVDLEAATGWLPHTTRAALTSLRNSGFKIERSKGNDGKTLYRIVAEPAAASHPVADLARRAA